jgi:translocator protein
MVFGFLECVAIAAWIPLVFMQWSRFSSMDDQSWYTSKRRRWMPPAWLFPVAWTLLYSALVIMMFFFTQNTLADSWQLIMGFVLFLFHIYWNKEWGVAFWDQKSPLKAFWILVLFMLPTSLILYVPFIVDNQANSLYYVPVIMVTLYNAWLLLAIVLNYYWLK